MKFLLLLIIAAAIYVGINWDTFSPKIDANLDAATQLKQKADELQKSVKDKVDQVNEQFEDVQDKLEDAKDKVSDTKEDASEAFEKLVDQVK